MKLKFNVFDPNNREFVKPKREVEQINRSSGLLAATWNSKRRLSAATVEKQEALITEATENARVLINEVPKLSLTLIFQAFLMKLNSDIKFFKIFVSAENLLNREFSNCIAKALNSNIKPSLIVDCSRVIVKEKVNLSQQVEFLIVDKQENQQIISKIFKSNLTELDVIDTFLAQLEASN